jgi:threonine synthase
VEEEMKRAYEEDQVVLDPHAAAASAALQAYQDDSSDDHAAVILGTVSPLKSARIVLHAAGQSENDPAQAMETLAELMGTDVPEALKGLFEKDSIHDKSINAEDVMSETTAILQLM